MPITGLDTTPMARANLLAWITSGKRAVASDNLGVQASRVSGVYLGSSGALVTAGEQSVLFTTDGGKPAVGAEVYAAAYTDDSNTGGGKATAIRPDVGKTMTDPTSLSGTPPQNVIRIGVCTDNSTYGSTKLCKVALQLPAFVSRVQQPDEQWFASAYDGFSSTKYLSLPGDTAGCDSPDDSTWGVIWNHTAAQVVNETIMGNFNGGGLSKGWILYFNTHLRAYYFTSGSPVPIDSNFGAQPGINVALFAKKGGVVTLTHVFLGPGAIGGAQGAQVSVTRATVASPVAPDNTCTFLIGGGSSPLDYLRGQAIQAVRWPYAMTEEEMVEIATNIVAPPGGGDRFRFPEDSTSPPLNRTKGAILNWHADNTTLIYDGNGNHVTTLTAHGGLTVTGNMFAEQHYRNIGRHMRECGEVLYDSNGLARPSTMLARIGGTWPLTNNGVMVEYETPEVYNGDELEAGVFKDGTCIAEPVRTGRDGPVSEWFNISSAVAASHDVDIVTSASAQKNGSWSGNFIRSIQGPANLTFKAAVPGRKRFLFVGSDEATGVDSGVSIHQTQMLAAKLRVAYEAGSPPWHFSCQAGMIRSLYNMVEQYGGGSVGPFVDLIVQDYLEGAPVSGVIAIMFANRDQQLATYTAAQFATRMGQLADGITAKLPTVPISFWRLNCPAGATPNANGETISQFNTALTALTSGRPMLTVPDGSTPNSVTFNAAGAAPNRFPDTAGIAALAQNIEAVIAP